MQIKFLKNKVIRLPVLLYNNTWSNGIETSESAYYDKLSSQFYHLEKSGFTSISVQQLINFIESGIQLPSKPVLIIFHNTYKSIATHLYPLLQKSRTKAVAFILPSVIEKDNYPQNHYLSIPEIKSISGEYIEWGIQSCSHGNPRKLALIRLSQHIRLCVSWFRSADISFVPALALLHDSSRSYNFHNRNKYFLMLHLSGLKLSFCSGNKISTLYNKKTMVLQKTIITGKETIEEFNDAVAKDKRLSIKTILRHIKRIDLLFSFKKAADKATLLQDLNRKLV